MDSLFATYASSDDEDEQQPQQPPPPPHKPPSHPQPSSKPTSSLSSSLPKPQLFPSSSTLFASLPPPKPDSTKPSSLFSILPPPVAQTTAADSPSLIPPPKPKRVVQFHLPTFNKDVNFRDDVDEEEEEEEDAEDRERKKRRQMGHDTSVKSFLSSIPAPKNSGAAALGASGGRRSIIDAGGPASAAPVAAAAPVAEARVEQNVESSSEYVGNVQQYDGVYNYDDATVYGSYEGYGGYESVGQQYYDGNNWNNNGGSDTGVSGEMIQATPSSSAVDSFVNMGGGRRRKDQPPAEIVEVKQDELMKNRPTQDPSKVTGIAFGPSYQPASSKGKPSKLHKRKHQISALYFDMRQKEMELQERRAKGFLTKSETQAKYGW